MDAITHHLTAAQHHLMLAKREPTDDLELSALLDTATAALDDALDQSTGDNEGVEVLDSSLGPRRDA